jgi:hypothetical protein
MLQTVDLSGQMYYDSIEGKWAGGLTGNANLECQ